MAAIVYPSKRLSNLSLKTLDEVYCLDILLPPVILIPHWQKTGFENVENDQLKDVVVCKISTNSHN